MKRVGDCVLTAFIPQQANWILNTKSEHMLGKICFAPSLIYTNPGKKRILEIYRWHYETSPM